jgi:hypothetical protein
LASYLGAVGTDSAVRAFIWTTRGVNYEYFDHYDGEM